MKFLTSGRLEPWLVIVAESHRNWCGGGGAGPQLQQVREEGVAEDEGVAGVAGGRPRPRLARLPGLPQLARVVVGLGLVIPPAQLLLYLMQILLMYSTDNFASKAMDYGLWSNLCILVCSYQ